MNKYTIKLNRQTYRWMMKQTREVQKVLGHIIATHWDEWKTHRLTHVDIQDVFIDLTNGADLDLGCEALDNLFHYDPVDYLEGYDLYNFS